MCACHINAIPGFAKVNLSGILELTFIYSSVVNAVINVRVPVCLVNKENLQLIRCAQTQQKYLSLRKRRRIKLQTSFRIGAVCICLQNVQVTKYERE